VNRWLRIAVFVMSALGLFGLLAVARMPGHEVAYDARAPLLVCPSQTRCYASYRLEVGNTGSEPQPQVRVRLDAARLDEAVLKPQVLVFGIRRLPLRAHDGDDGIRTIAFGPLAARDRATVEFMLATAGPDDVPDWATLRLGVEPARGAAHAGSPAALTFGRLLFAMTRGIAALIP
jgi:hypothetical protein